MFSRVFSPIVLVRMRVHKIYVRALRKNIVGAFAPKLRIKNEWNKWKNHFCEMKGDVGMSVHEKEREQEDMPTPRHKLIHNPILHLCFFQDNNVFYVGNSI